MILRPAKPLETSEFNGAHKKKQNITVLFESSKKC